MDTKKEQLIKDNKKLLEINNYYDDALTRAREIMYALQDLDMKHNIKLPNYLLNDVDDFLNKFKYRYHDRDN